MLIFSVTLVSIKYNIGLTKKEALLHLSDKERLLNEALINTGTFCVEEAEVVKGESMCDTAEAEQRET